MPRFALATLNHSPMFGCPTQWRAHLDATAAAGFEGLAPDIFWLRALEREGLPLERLVEAMVERSLACTELAGLTIADVPAAQLDTQLAELVRYARLLSAEFVNARLLIPPDESAVALVRRIATAFGEVGARLALEFSNTTTLYRLRDAAAFVDAVAHAGVGLTVDTWHFFQDRAGADWEGLDALSTDRLATLQLSDGLPVKHAERASFDYSDQTMHHRCLAGAGGFDLARCARTLRSKGFHGAVVVEVLSAEQRARPLGEFARDAAASALGWWS